MNTDNQTETGVSRRRALGLLALSGAAVAVGAAPATLHAADVFDPASITTPEQALAELMAGNARFVAGRTVGPNRSMARLKEVVPTQRPFAAVLSCADSRVPPEILFDQGFGDVFVCRAAGNIVTPELIGSLEFGTLVLGSKVLMVMGHTGCGAVKATIAGDAVPGQISTLYRHIQPAVDRVASRELEAVTRENVRVQARLLRTSSPVVAQLVRDKKLVVAGGVYDLATGRVTAVEV
ncbi:MAG: Carbonic anhydrase, beta class [uncultured Gemmatimonadetes bacterium]|uniref:carbonic anhydrase n=1 Tax=uncultured Gemmatimonadota bacterium TaxID=203437 RepID=A0A6J4M4F4_9BACT|nr:MAG: Carbonic anhydrase, beta class [uncultured Gemmatimonadota bacterium]